MLSIPSGSRSTYIGAGYRIAAAMAALEDTDLQAAESHLEAMAGHHAPEHRAPLTYVRTLLIEATDGVAGALNYLESRRRRGGRSPDPHVDRMLQALHSRLAWQSGRVQARSKNEPGGMAGIFAALSRNDARQALALATELCRSPAARDTPRVHTEALLLKALAAMRLGDEERAAGLARAATRLMAELGTNLPMRVIPAAEARQLAARVPGLPVAHAADAVMHMITPLTPSEQRALSAVVRYGSVPEAAKAIFLSQDTVKGHMKQIYRKLGVRSRDSAVMVATRAGLLPYDAEEPR